MGCIYAHTSILYILINIYILYTIYNIRYWILIYLKVLSWQSKIDDFDTFINFHVVT